MPGRRSAPVLPGFSCAAVFARGPVVLRTTGGISGIFGGHDSGLHAGRRTVPVFPAGAGGCVPLPSLFFFSFLSSGAPLTYPYRMQGEKCFDYEMDFGENRGDLEAWRIIRAREGIIFKEQKCSIIRVPTIALCTKLPWFSSDAIHGLKSAHVGESIFEMKLGGNHRCK